MAAPKKTVNNQSRDPLLNALRNRTNSIPEVFLDYVFANPNTTLFSQARVLEEDEVDWQDSAASEVVHRVHAIALALKERGVRRGTRVGIIAQIRPEWSEAALAIYSLGAVLVAIPDLLAAHQIATMIYETKCEIFFAENDEQVQKLLLLSKGPIQIPEREGIPATKAQLNINSIISFESVTPHPKISQFSLILAAREVKIEKAEEAPASAIRTDQIAMEECKALKALALDLNHEDLAAIFLSEEEDQPPNSVQQSHGSILNAIHILLQSDTIPLDHSVFLAKPLWNSAAHVICCASMLQGNKLCFSAATSRTRSVRRLDDTARDLRASGAQTAIVTNRLLVEISYAIEKKSEQPGLEGSKLTALIDAANKAIDAPTFTKPISILHRLGFFFSRFFKESIKVDIFGTKLVQLISWGTPLPPFTRAILECMGLRVSCGLALPELCGFSHLTLHQTNQHNRYRSLGTPMPETTAKTLSDGEIWIRTPSAAIGYIQRSTSNLEVWQGNGWIAPQLYGQINQDDKSITILGRKSERIVLLSGDIVHPIVIEQLIRNCPLIIDACLIGDGRPYLIAVLTVRRSLTSEEAQLVEDHINAVSLQHKAYEEVKRFFVVEHEFIRGAGLLTANGELRRKKIAEAYANEINKLY